MILDKKGSFQWKAITKRKHFDETFLSSNYFNEAPDSCLHYLLMETETLVLFPIILWKKKTAKWGRYEKLIKNSYLPLRIF